jgi:hypothetical protein
MHGQYGGSSRLEGGDFRLMDLNDHPTIKQLKKELLDIKKKVENLENQLSLLLNVIKKL